MRPGLKHAVLLAGVLALARLSARSEETISSTEFHLAGHARPATIEIVMTGGRFYNDEQGWCGGGEKWEGQFQFRVRIGRRFLSKTSVNRLFYPKEPSTDMFFWSPKFKLVMRDYNRDGQMDFNLGQYGSCVSNDYRIFTIEPNGAILELRNSRHHPDGLSVSWADKDNSTWRIKLFHGLLTTAWYNRAGADIVEQRAWRRHRFVLIRSKPGDYSDDMENGPSW
jgi:hypothetical protein